ncbi:MAG: GNAT family N-acetyltransferase [Saprospiraceae bacterium]|nr:GNAT family N-acetyltransferase [Saprospiraceae bacterium]
MNSGGIREAIVEDIPAIQFVRHAVLENRLSDPGRVTDEDVRQYILHRGKGWIYEQDDSILGFAIGDLQDANIWALFVLPEAERKGIGRLLHDTMVHWMFAHGIETIWLSTAPGTRAEGFYQKAGWQDKRMTEQGEIYFELSRANG